ncbi:AMP-binding protein [Rhizobium grahamii]|uniref:AMP-dependent synthetase and ligase n=1 Tax=Rhizobium grahamii CCGE 502 TaxID=990285 RepID=S3HB65_9HYPH|nr:AMP-binding protein [Rhizobium grahamii]EPE95829.1 AMP-dependent synthetase and ligase [Rhizobium grahamii CCGE 502]
MLDGFWTRLDCGGDRAALLLPSRPAVTYRELADRVATLSRALGTSKKLIAVEAAQSEHSIIAYLAALAGGHAVALLPSEDRVAWSSFLERFAPEIVYRREGGRWRLTETNLGSGGVPVHPDLALMLVTSGSTGSGKAVRLSKTAVAANAEQIAGYLGLQASDVGALVLPLHYSYGLSVLNSHLAVGAAVWMPGTSVLESTFLDDFRTARCTNFAGVPHSYELLEQRGFREQHYPDLRFMTVAGGRMESEAVRRYHGWLQYEGQRFYVMYGQTEATARIAYVPPEHLPGSADRIGTAVPGGELWLVDEKGAIITDTDVAGELVYRGPNVMLGYADTRQDLARGADIEELRTGDLAARDADGLFRITGRLRRMSKIGGVRLGHDALEAALAAKGITAAVVGNDQQLLAAFAGSQREEDVREALAVIAGIGLPQVRAIGFEELPRLANGKIDYEHLRLRMESPTACEQATVLSLFREVFFPRRISPNDSFAELGGDSLRYLELTVGLERLLGRVPDGWEKITVGVLAGLSHSTNPQRTIASDILLKSIAILLVVLHHATPWPIPGGAGTMLVLCGYGLARFQSSALFAGDLRRFLLPLSLVLWPYYLVVLGFSIAWGAIPWASVFLVGNLGFAEPDRHEMLPYLYWFVEAFAQLLMLWGALFAVPSIRRSAARDPFRFGMLFLAFAVLAHFAVPVLSPIGQRQIFTLAWVLHLAVFGWCAAFANSRRRRLAVIAAGCAVMPLMAYTGGNWAGSWVLYGMQLPVLAVLLYVPRVKLPTTLAAVLVAVAAASYHIYLLHRILPEALFDSADPATFNAPLPVAVSVVSGLLSGILAHQLQRRVMLGQRLWAGLSRFGDYLRQSGRQGMSFGSSRPLVREQQRSRVSP